MKNQISAVASQLKWWEKSDNEAIKEFKEKITDSDSYNVDMYIAQYGDNAMVACKLNKLMHNEIYDKFDEMLFVDFAKYVIQISTTVPRTILRNMEMPSSHKPCSNAEVFAYNEAKRKFVERLFEIVSFFNDDEEV